MPSKTATGPQFSLTGSYLTEQLRESLPYLEEEGWTNTAELMRAAATELERLTLKVEKFERRQCDADQAKIKTSKRSRLVLRLFG